jgi:hypothetical protein
MKSGRAEPIGLAQTPITKCKLKGKPMSQKSESEKIRALKEEFIKNITDYMKFGGAENEEDPDYDPSFDAGYNQSEIDHAGVIIETYLNALAAIPPELKNPRREDAILVAAKTAVLAFNKLNEDCEQPIIETDQREMLCELLLSAAHEVGLEGDEDITEEWREW